MAEYDTNPTFEQLLVEQETVQAGKFRARMHDDYHQLMFPGQDFVPSLSSAVTDLARTLCVGEEKVTLNGILRGLSREKGGDAVQWVDMGGGRGLALRQVMTEPSMREVIQATNVDLFDWGLDDLRNEDYDYLERRAPGVTQEENAPQYVKSDIVTVELEQPADLITSVENIQYLNDPLKAVGNWYNQLADNGLMIVASEHDWSESIDFIDGDGERSRAGEPSLQLLSALDEAGIAYAATRESDFKYGRPNFNPRQFRSFAIRKKAGTRAIMNGVVSGIWPNDGYKVVSYEPPRENQPFIEVVNI